MKKLILLVLIGMCLTACNESVNTPAPSTPTTTGDKWDEKNWDEMNWQ